MSMRYASSAQRAILSKSSAGIVSLRDVLCTLIAEGEGSVHNFGPPSLLLQSQVPTFLFYRGGKEVGRFAGSSRGELHRCSLQSAQLMHCSCTACPKASCITGFYWYSSSESVCWCAAQATSSGRSCSYRTPWASPLHQCNGQLRRSSSASRRQSAPPGDEALP